MRNNKFYTITTIICLSFGLIGFVSSCKDSQTKETTVQTKDENRPHPASGVQQKSEVKKPRPQRAKKTSGPKPGEPLIAGELEWLHIEDAGKLKNSDGKKFLVDVYTDWCGWCKVMDKQTFSDPEIQAFLNENFHVVKFNAEQRESINFLGEQYDLIKSGRNGVNALAVKLLGQRLSYPTIVYLDENLNKITAVPGFKKPDQLMQTLKMIAG